MIETPQFTFSSAPKTGCRWMEKACKQAYHQQFKTNGHLHDGIRIDGKRAIAFVRDPADWLRSYYQNITLQVGVPDVDVFLTCREGEPHKDTGTIFGLKRFIECYLRMPSNSVYKAFTAYPADVRLKVEDMPFPMEVITGFALRGIDYNKTPHRLSISNEIRHAIYQHEPELCNEFLYGKGT